MTTFSDDAEKYLTSIPEASPTMQRLLRELGEAFPKPKREGNAAVVELANDNPATQAEKNRHSWRAWMNSCAKD